MTHRDRAWRRRVSRIVEHRNDESREQLAGLQKEAKVPATSDRPHRPGKLTHAQAMRLDHQLRYEASDGWVGDTPVPASPEAIATEQS
jgi:hypothetical protein